MQTTIIVRSNHETSTDPGSQNTYLFMYLHSISHSLDHFFFKFGTNIRYYFFQQIKYIHCPKSLKNYLHYGLVPQTFGFKAQNISLEETAYLIFTGAVSLLLGL